MDTIRIAAVAGDESDRSHMAIREKADGSRTIVKDFASLDKARSFCEAMVELSSDLEQGWPVKEKREKKDKAPAAA
jgi:hypothetical protein